MENRWHSRCLALSLGSAWTKGNPLCVLALTPYPTVCGTRSRQFRAFTIPGLSQAWGAVSRHGQSRNAPGTSERTGCSGHLSHLCHLCMRQLRHSENTHTAGSVSTFQRLEGLRHRTSHGSSTAVSWPPRQPRGCQSLSPVPCPSSSSWLEAPFQGFHSRIVVLLCDISSHYRSMKQTSHLHPSTPRPARGQRMPGGG